MTCLQVKFSKLPLTVYLGKCELLWNGAKINGYRSFQSLFYLSFMSLLWGCASWHPNTTGWTATEWVAPKVLFSAPGNSTESWALLPAICLLLNPASVQWCKTISKTRPLSWVFCRIFPNIQVTRGEWVPTCTDLAEGEGALLSQLFLWCLADSHPAVLSTPCLT